MTKKVSSTLISIASVVVFLVGLGLFLSTRAQQSTAPAKDVVITYLVTRNGQPSGIYSRSAKANGEALEIRQEFKGKSSVWSWTPDAVYMLPDGASAKQYVSTNGLKADRNYRSEEFLRSQANFGEENILGFQAFIIGTEKDSVVYKRWQSPLLGISPLKVVMSNDGDETVVQAVKVEFKELSESDVKLPDGPVSFDFVERKVEGLKQAGHIDQANQLSETINRLKNR